MLARLDAALVAEARACASGPGDIVAASSQPLISSEGIRAPSPISRPVPISIRPGARRVRLCLYRVDGTWQRSGLQSLS